MVPRPFYFSYLGTYLFPFQSPHSLVWSGGPFVPWLPRWPGTVVRSFHSTPTAVYLFPYQEGDRSVRTAGGVQHDCHAHFHLYPGVRARGDREDPVELVTKKSQPATRSAALGTLGVEPCCTAESPDGSARSHSVIICE